MAILFKVGADFCKGGLVLFFKFWLWCGQVRLGWRSFARALGKCVGNCGLFLARG